MSYRLLVISTRAYILFIVVYGATPCYGSFGGGTLLTIKGRGKLSIICIALYCYMLLCISVMCCVSSGFAADQFNDKDPSLGNKVIFYDSFRKFPCNVIPYFSSTEKIVCRTK